MVSLWLDTYEAQYCKRMAKFAEIGGGSQVRTDNRASSLTMDQIVGQLGQYALSIYLFGTPAQYYTQRMSANINPKIGDNGQDILGANLDVKTSLMRDSQYTASYRLAIRPKERHDGHVYYLALVKPNGDSSLKMDEPILVYIVGWASDNDLPDKPDDDGVFKGAYTLKADKLNVPAPIQWDWRKYDSL